MAIVYLLYGIMAGKLPIVSPNLVDRWNALYPPEDLNINGPTQFSVYKVLKDRISKVLKSSTTHAIIFEGMDDYNNIITEETKAKIFDAISEIAINPNDLHELTYLAKKQLQSLCGKIVTHLPWWNTLDMSMLLSKKHHSSVFNNLSTPKQEMLVKKSEDYLDPLGYKKVKFHRDFYQENSGKSFSYIPNYKDKESYRQAAKKNILSIDEYDKNLLSSIINHPQYQTIRKPLLMEFHELVEQDNIPEMYRKAIVFMQSHDHTLLSEDTVHLIYICLHCDRRVRPVIRSIFYYFDDLAHAYNLQDKTRDEKNQHLHHHHVKKSISRIKYFQKKEGKYSPSTIFDDKKTGKEDIFQLDESAIKELVNHYVTCYYDSRKNSIPPVSYQGGMFYFNQFVKSDNELKQELGKKANNFSDTNFTHVYVAIQQKSIQYLYLYDRLGNNPRIDNIAEHVSEVEGYIMQNLSMKDFVYLDVLNDLPKLIHHFYDDYLLNQKYPGFLCTSDPGHGLASKPSLSFWSRYILQEGKMSNYLPTDSTKDQIIMLEDDVVQASAYLSTIISNKKAATHLTTGKDILQYLKNDKNQIFLLDLQQPEDLLGGLHAMQSIISYRESSHPDSYTNRIRIHLRSVDEAIHNIGAENKNLSKRAEKYNIIISFGEKGDNVLDSLL